MKQICPDVYLLEKLKGANSYLLLDGERMTLLDAGMPADSETIKAQILETGLPIFHLESIILTHGHIDHAGSTNRLRDLSGAKILAHELDVPYLLQHKKFPARTAAQKIVYGFMDWMIRLEPITVEEILHDGDTIPGPIPLQVIHTPGHTPGSISLYDPGQGTLFCGDALFNAHPLTGQKGLRFPIWPVTLDPEAARRSVERLSNLEIKILCPGHGKPIRDHPREHIKRLLESAL